MDVGVRPDPFGELPGCRGSMTLLDRDNARLLGLGFYASVGQAQEADLCYPDRPTVPTATCRGDPAGTRDAARERRSLRDRPPRLTRPRARGAYCLRYARADAAADHTASRL